MPEFPLAAADVGVWRPLQEVLLLLAAAMLLGALAERVKQSAIVGYLVAGTIVGPNVLGWVDDQRRIFLIAEVGVALLLFVIGLEFSPRRLWEFGPRTMLVGVLQVVFTAAIGFAAAKCCGLDPRAATVVGLMVAMSSTACVLRLLAEQGELDSAAGRTSLAILLVQDIAVVPMMLVVSAMTTEDQGASIGALLGKSALTVLLAATLVVAMYGIFKYVVPRLRSQRSMTRNRDLPVLLAIVLALGSAWVAHTLELSPALGAFAAGVLLAVSPYATQIRADVRPLSTVLVTLFFVSIGMFGDPMWLVGNVALVTAVVAAIVVGKPLVIAVVSYTLGLPLRYAAAAGLTLAQVGEFSFVLATIAQGEDPDRAILSPTVFRALVTATIASLLLTPYLVAAGPHLGAWLAERFGRRSSRPAAPDQDAKRGYEIADRVMIIGFGPAGQRVAEGLLAAYAESDTRDAEDRVFGPERITVVDLNPSNISVGRRYGAKCVVGDATQPDVLEHAGLHASRVVVIAVPDHAAARQIVHLARGLAPDAELIVRCRYHVRHWELILAGAHEVIDEEDLIGRRLAADARSRLADEPDS